MPPRLGYLLRMSKLPPLALFIWLASVGAVWIPLVTVEQVVLEASNVGTLLLLGFAPLVFWQTDVVYLPKALNAMVLLLVCLAVAFVLRDMRGLGSVLISLPAVLAAYVLANMPLPTPRELERVVAFSFAGLFGIMLFSTAAAGLNLFQGIFHYLTTFDRVHFVFLFLRPSWNAFAAGDDSIQYSAAVLNSFSAALALFFLLSGCLAWRGSRLMLAVAIISLLTVLTLFSTAAVLVVAAGSLVFLAHMLLRTHRKVLLLFVFGVMLAAAPVALSTVQAYLSANIAEDELSRQARIQQYTAAANMIDDSPIIGVGYQEINGRVIHNLFLYSWTSAGIFGLAASIAVYVSVLVISINGIVGALSGTRATTLYLMMGILPILLLVHIMVAGSGGVPAGAAVLGLAIALMARRQLRLAGERFYLDRYIPRRLV